MHVIKRNGQAEPVNFNKVSRRIQDLCQGLDVDPLQVALRTLEGLHDGITTRDLDALAAENAANMAIIHPDYNILGGRILLSDLRKSTPESFSAAVQVLHEQTEVISKPFFNFVQRHSEALDIQANRGLGYDLDYFGFKTLERAYLNRVHSVIVERPEYMYMRVAIQMNLGSLERTLETFYYLSHGYYSHATPTLFHSGHPKPQLASCYLLTIGDDSLRAIYKCLGDCAQISKFAGGIGLSVSHIRSKGSHIKGTNGTSNGIIPMLRVFDTTSQYVDQGGNKRPGSIAVYLEPWHPEVLQFLDLRKNHGAEDLRARNLFLALWVNDIFMERVEANGPWSLFCPSDCPDLIDLWGERFSCRYREYEEVKGLAKATVPARQIWQAMLTSQEETGTPYVMFKAACNRKSNQRNLGTIRSSNLCVAPYTRILTRQGYIPIVDLKDQALDVWNGFEWSTVTVRQTGSQKSLVRVTLSNGSVLDCTPEHQFYVNTGYYRQNHRDAVHDEKVTKVVAAAELSPGDKLIKHELPDSSTPATHFVTVKSVEALTGLYDTYCFTEDKLGLGTFEGVVTGQCSEIVQYTSAEETAVCNLASIALPTFACEDGTYDFKSLREVVAHVVENLNTVIDLNYYPTIEACRSNLRHRPIGIGVQGLATLFFKLDIAYESPAAAELNRRIFEHIYYAAVEKSCKLAAAQGAYATFQGSPASEGLLQPDLWDTDLSESELDWKGLRTRVKEYGLRNSLLIAVMPTASTSQILGNSPSTEPLARNLFTRKTLSGNFMVVNDALVKDLLKLDLWDEKMRHQIMSHYGSIQAIPGIPDEVKAKYKTAYEISKRTLVNMARGRAQFIDQAESFNVHLRDTSKLSKVLLYAWKQGLKNGIYYLHSEPSYDPTQVTVPILECESCSA